MTEWMPLEELERMLSMVDVFGMLPPQDMRALASALSFASVMPLPGGGLGRSSPGNDGENSKTYSRGGLEKNGGVHVPKPKTEAKRTVEKVSSRKGSGDKKIERPAGAGRGVAKVRKSARDLKRNGGAPTTSALYPVGEISIPVASELTKIGLPDNEITP
ncbi:MAG: hypothetical protein LC781_11080, partial [Actinobacteria bacterium]|nr:hypothetical protein [Actinomycetota bacterium]